MTSLPRLLLGGLVIALLPLGASAAPPTHLLIFTGQSNMKNLDPVASVLPTLEAAFPDDEFIVVKYAISAQPIQRWDLQYELGPVGEGGLPDFRHPDGDMYLTLMGMVDAALVDQPAPDTVTLFWMQGEADTHTAAQWTVYEESLNRVIDEMRIDLDRPDITFVVGRISDYIGDTGEYVNGSAAIREALVSVAENDPLGTWIDTDDLNGDNDGLHYSGNYQELGERFASAAVPLIASSVPEPGSAILAGLGLTTILSVRRRK